jgi:hypothetical protein
MQQKNKIDESQLNSSPKIPIIKNFLELAQFKQGKVVPVVPVAIFIKLRKLGLWFKRSSTRFSEQQFYTLEEKTNKSDERKTPMIF